jgi:predicted dienelactone hydrolase
MKPLRRWCVALTLVLGTTALCAQTATFRFLPEPGPMPVGLKVVSQYDASRTFPSADGGVGEARGRPLQTLVWYPAQGRAGKAMTVGDYASLADSETRFNHPDPVHNKWRAQLKASADVSLWARRDALMAKGPFPVVIYAPSDSSIAWENADLCEYLASHGYVVVASPSMGVSTRDMTDDNAGIDAQAADIRFLITYAATLPDADVSHLAVASWSWGGISSLFAAARDPRIKALASMDGSMRYFPGLVTKAGDVHPGTMRIPLLFLTSAFPNWLEDVERDTDDSPAMRTGPNVLNAWTHGDLYTVNMLGMSHGEFSSMFQRRKSAERFAEDQIADYGRDDANTGHAWSARYILAFLDATLKHDAASAAFLKRTPAENGVPPHFMAATFRAATPPVSVTPGQ